MVSVETTIRVFSDLRDAIHRETGEINIMAKRMVADYDNHAPAMAAFIEKQCGRPAKFPARIEV